VSVDGPHEALSVHIDISMKSVKVFDNRWFNVRVPIIGLVGFEVFTVLRMWVVTHRSLESFGGTYCLHLQVRS
jgi:hypothetical protein